MFDSSIIFIFLNISLLTLIFWIVMVVGEKFLYKNDGISSKETFECGFLSINNLKVKPNSSFLVVALLLIIYDLEFFFFAPIFFNICWITYQHLIIILLVYMLIIISFIFDWQNITLNWFI